MSEEKNGGAAFPVPKDADTWGMTLRDYFAVHATIEVQTIVNILVATGKKDASADDVAKLEATLRYNKADAMLRERAQ